MRRLLAVCSTALVTLIALTRLAGASGVQAPQAPAPAPFRIEEATIAQIHAAMKAGQVTCRALVEQYLRRIDAYDGTARRSTRSSWSTPTR